MEQQLDYYSRKGLRTLALAMRRFSPQEAEKMLAKLTEVR